MLSATNGRVVHWISSLDDSGQCGLVDFQLVWVAFRVRNTQVQLQIAMHLLACFIGMNLMHLSRHSFAGMSSLTPTALPWKEVFPSPGLSGG